MSTETRRAVWDTDAPLMKAVRHEVFVEEQSVDPNIEWDGRDEACEHVVVFEAGRCVGTGRLTPEGRIGRMAVLRECRGHGHGGAMLAALIDIARSKGLEEVSLHAQVHAINFYERYGFVAEGEVFQEAGIDHRHMVLRL